MHPGKNTGVGCHFLLQCMHAKLLQSCPTLCNPTDSSSPGSPVPGILQARTPEWGAISFSNACMLSCFTRVRFRATPWTAAHQAPLSTGFSRQEYWSGLLFPIPGNLPDPGKEAEFPAAPALAGRFFTTEPPAHPNRGITSSVHVAPKPEPCPGHEFFAAWSSPEGEGEGLWDSADPASRGC